MVIFTIKLMVRSRSQKGSGKLAWRQWRVSRWFFENHELPRLPEIGREIAFGLCRVVCTESRDSFGCPREDEWDYTIAVAKFYFTLAPDWPLPRWLQGIRCYEDDLSPTRLREVFEQAGFQVTIDRPCEEQEPTQTPPPADA